MLFKGVELSDGDVVELQRGIEGAFLAFMASNSSAGDYACGLDVHGNLQVIEPGEWEKVSLVRHDTFLALAIQEYNISISDEVAAFSLYQETIENAEYNAISITRKRWETACLRREALSNVIATMLFAPVDKSVD